MGGETRLSTAKTTIAIAPEDIFGVRDVVLEAGGTLGEPEEADAIIWSDPRRPQALGELLSRSKPAWVQLTSAGIEGFVEADVLDRSVTWTCAKGIYGRACGEHALALMLMAARRLHHHACHKSRPVEGFGARERTLADTQVLVVGTGGIGRAVIRMLKELRVRTVAVNRSGRRVEGATATNRIEFLPKVIGDAEFVALALPLTVESRHLINREMLELMRDDAWIINVARGALIDTTALVEAVRDRSIGGAALDVTDPEPLPDDHPLRSFENVVITPHIAATWEMSLPEFRGLVGRNVANFVGGRPLEGQVDPGLGY